MKNGQNLIWILQICTCVRKEWGKGEEEEEKGEEEEEEKEEEEEANR